MLLTNVDVSVAFGGVVVSQISGGEQHMCALLKDGAVRCWGYNGQGQLGLGTTEDVGDNKVPADFPPIDLGAKVIQVAVGASFTCALVDDEMGGGKVKCWGFGDYGQLGDGVATKGYRKYVPGVPIEELEDVESIAVGNWQDRPCPWTTPHLCFARGREVALLGPRVERSARLREYE